MKFIPARSSNWVCLRAGINPALTSERYRSNQNEEHDVLRLLVGDNFALICPH